MVDEAIIWQNQKLKKEEPKRQDVPKATKVTEEREEDILAKLGVTSITPKKRTGTKIETEVEKPKNRSKGRLLRTLGNLLILISVVGLVYTLYPIAKAEISYRVGKLFGVRFSLDQPQPQKTTFGELLGGDNPTILVPKSTDFGIIVEKIGANAKIVADVNAADQKEYNLKLQKGVAHARGTALPGEKGVSFLFAHSVLNPWDVPRYNAVFYLLRELEAGDRIVIFWQGRRFDYIAYNKQIVGPNDVQFLNQNYSEPILVLQTCDPPGTTWRRLLIFAKLASAT